MLVFEAQGVIFEKKSPCCHFTMIEFVFTRMFSPFVILYLIWFYVYREKCVSAGYGQLAYLDLKFALVDLSQIQIRKKSDRMEISFTPVNLRAACYLVSNLHRFIFSA